MGIAAGLAAGLIGAIVWAMVAWYANLEIGWLAWGIGAFVGIACAAGSALGRNDKEAQTGAGLGIAAVLITILSICGGKFGVVEAQVQQALGEARVEADALVNQEFTEEMLVSYVADKIGEETHGPMWALEYDWPDGVDPSYAEAKSDYPAKLWKQATKRWGGMSDTERAEFEQATRDNLRAGSEAYFANAAGEVRAELFTQSFGMMDLLFFGLAVFTAWRIAGAGEMSE